MQKKLSVVKGIIYIGLILALTVPSLIFTLYSYPVQDDFHYAYTGRNLMREGYNLITASLYEVGEHYRTFQGCYSSVFFGYFFCTLINADIVGIRIFELLNAIVFYFALYALLRAIITCVMGYDKEKTVPVYILLLLCFNGLIYYADHDDFYWLITSAAYLLILSFIFFGMALFLHALSAQNKKAAVGAAVLGFLGSGGALNIAALCCIIYLLAAIWGFFVKKEKWMSGVIFFIVLAGGLINGLAPGNYVRVGDPVTFGKLITALVNSLVYLLQRMEMLIKNPIYIMVVVILMAYLLTCKSGKTEYRFYMPVLFMGIMISLAAVVIFPVMLGYGWEVYQVICRSNFISDTAIYLFTFFALFYLRGWLEERFPEFGVPCRFKNFMLTFLVAALVIIVWRRDWSYVPFLRQAREWHHGVCREYSDYVIGVYKQIEEAKGNAPEIVIKNLQDSTCMNNPDFYIGWYDMEAEWANRTIANFYGKDAVYIFYEE